jgi:hypothetical protein
MFPIRRSMQMFDQPLLHVNVMICLVLMREAPQFCRRWLGRHHDTPVTTRLIVHSSFVRVSAYSEPMALVLFAKRLAPDAAIWLNKLACVRRGQKNHPLAQSVPSPKTVHFRKRLTETNEGEAAPKSSWPRGRSEADAPNGPSRHRASRLWPESYRTLTFPLRSETPRE